MRTFIVCFGLVGSVLCLEQSCDASTLQGRCAEHNDGASVSMLQHALLTDDGHGRDMQVTGYSVFDGSLLAQRFSASLRKLLPWRRHHVDVVASQKHSFVYVDNVKAGSSSIRAAFQHNLKVNWWATDVPRKPGHNHKADEPCTLNVTKMYGMGNRLKSDMLCNVSGLFVFSFVREPVKKFESGVLETWFSDPTLQRFQTADALLDHQLEMGDSWVNEHLQPSSWRLTADLAGSPINMDFIGHLENIDQEWPFVLQRLGLENESVPLLENRSRSDQHAGLLSNASLNNTLSAEGVLKMCKSELYGFEWEFFGYPVPRICRTSKVKGDRATL